MRLCLVLNSSNLFLSLILDYSLIFFVFVFAFLS